jgi:DNA polymerase-3 subunit epsilon
MAAQGNRFRWIGLSDDGESVLLKHFHGEFQAPDFATAEWFQQNPQSWRLGAVLDTETSGTNFRRDKIIEIGIRLFRFCPETGQVLSREQGYSALQDPGFALSPEIVRITGITDDMVKGQSIDWKQVETLLDPVHILVAHNAGFDRPFVDPLVPTSSKKIWGCSFRQIDWLTKGFPSQKLEILSIYHGFFCHAHRALADADTLLHLLGMPDPLTGAPYLKELLVNARRRLSHVSATYSPFETKDVLRERGYRWDTEKRVWSKVIYAEEQEGETAWLCEKVYSGKFRGTIRQLDLTETFLGDR